jgi:hypothetical protein
MCLKIPMKYRGEGGVQGETFIPALFIDDLYPLASMAKRYVRSLKLANVVISLAVL